MINENEKSYYSELGKKLDELQNEKLMQLENLKSICSFPQTLSLEEQA